MKKIAAVLATVMVAGTLMVACGNEEAVVEIEETTAVEETTEAVVEEVATEVVETEVATEEATTEVAEDAVAEEVATEEKENEQETVTKQIALKIDGTTLLTTYFDQEISNGILQKKSRGRDSEWASVNVNKSNNKSKKQ